jgi:titin
VALTGLTNGTLYTVQLRAVNAAGAGAASTSVSVTPVASVVLPTVTAPTSVSVTASSATLGGMVTADGGAPVTERGVVVALTSSGVTPILGGAGVMQLAATVAGTGSYSLVATGLASSASYSFRAYASNSAGTAYSSAATFTTLGSTAALNGLVLSIGALSPAFASDLFDYVAVVPHTTSVLRLTATASAGAIVTEVQLNGGGYSPVTSGTMSGALPLQVGTNLIQVRVTAQDGTTQQVYAVTVTRPGAPAAPTGLVATPGNGSATIEFVAGADGGSALANYEYSLTGGASWLSAGTSSSPVVITGLLNGTAYTVLLRAVTAAGLSPASAPVAVTPSTTPGVPTGLAVTSGSRRVTIWFTGSSTGGSPITGYNYSLDDGLTWTASGLTTSPMVVTGLTNGRTYVVRVRAVNAVGLGPMSAAMAVTPEAVPVTFAVSPASWAAPVVGGTQQVQVTASTDDGTWSASTEATWLTLGSAGGVGSGVLSITAAPQPSYAVARSATVLVAGQSVTVTQAATTEPGPPQQLTATLTGQRVVFRWNAPEDPGAGVGSYVLEYGFTPGRSDGAGLAVGAGREFAVTVPPGRFYVRVKAQNAYGISAPSNEVELRAGVTAAPPSRPQAVTVLVTGATLQLSWSAPAGGDAPTGYLLEAGTASGLSNVTTVPLGPSTTFVADGIPPGLYYVRLRAVNSFGMSEPSEDALVVVGGVAQPPQRPTGVVAAEAGGTVTFSWNAPTQGGVPTGYVLEAGTGPGLSDITTLPIGVATTYTVGGVPPGVYFVRVRAVNALGVSGPSSEVMVTVPATDRADAGVAGAARGDAAGFGGPRQGGPSGPLGLQGRVAGDRVALWWFPVRRPGRVVTSRVEVLSEPDGPVVTAVDAGESHEVSFAGVPAGRYVVRVRACVDGADVGLSPLLHVWVPEP